MVVLPLLLFLLSLLFSITNPPCIDPFTTINWEFFAKSIKVKGGCACNLTPGVLVEYYEPFAFIEITHEKFSFPCIGAKGGNTKSKRPKYSGKVYMHFIRFPILDFVNIYLDCSKVSIKEYYIPAGMSELNPLLSDEKLYFFAFNDLSYLLSKEAVLSCGVDCLQRNDTLFWCAGCWGVLFPPIGSEIPLKNLPHREALLFASRLLFFLHQSLLLEKTYPTAGENPSLYYCSKSFVPTNVFVKSQYKLQIVYPHKSKVFSIGEFITQYLEDIKEQDYVILVWRKRICCVGAVK